ncbi:hypothetical protein QYE76_065982 [Lolium multiflorum]|uniref:Transposase (putative) gypsy type domain-containing protein n=1 Tax=Lolium multiflorum TaxID=4521 RepID=A0AAD8SBV7_LOLMU|nr:hypothetical protein QYE76_065982 [Lolium multiflorum]
MRSTNLLPRLINIHRRPKSPHSPPIHLSTQRRPELSLRRTGVAGISPEFRRSAYFAVVFFVFLTPASHRVKTSSPATPATANTIPMSSATPPPSSEPIMATPISSAPPPFAPVQLDPTKDSGKDTEGISAIPEKASGEEQADQKAEEVAAKKSKARKRDSESKGKWWPCTTTDTELNNLEAEGFLKPKSWRTIPGSLAPAPEAGEMVVTKALVEHGFSFPPSDFFSEILKVYGLQPHNISPNSILAITNHATLCEGHLRIPPELPLFQYFFSVKKEKIPKASELATCGSITFMLRPGRVYPPTDRHESARYWSGGLFYLKDVSDPASERLTRAVRRICKLTEEGLTGKDLTMSWFTRRIQPLQHRDRLMFQYTGRDDPMRACKDNLSADAIDKRIRLLIKIPRDLHIHVCNKDIHTDGSGTALEALEESELGTLLRVPQAGNNDPEAASEAEAPEVPRPSKRRKAASSSPAAKRAREAPSIAATRKAEAEKKRLKLIDTSNRAQPNIQHTSSGSQAPRIAKKKVKPSPASMPVTPEVEVPPKASSAAKPDPKDVINLDDLPEDPTAESGKGDSGKDASSTAPPPEQPNVTSTEAPADQVEKKLALSGPRTRLHLILSVLQKAPLAQRHAEISDMMEKVWGPANTEEQELADHESGLKVFFAKHKNVRQNTRKLHEDLRTHILERKKEIDLLQARDADSQKAIALLETRLKNFEEENAKRPSIDDLSAKIKVLEAENESLKNFMKESSVEENKKRKELLEKHAQEVSDLAEKLKKSHQRVQTLASKNKSYEAEAEAIDKMIFPSLGLEWTKDAVLNRTEAYEEAHSSIDNLFEACRGVAKSLSLKRAGTAVMDTMTKLIKQVPELIMDWQESSARGVASLVLATCKAHVPTMNFSDVARGVPKSANLRKLLAETQGFDRVFVGRVNHSFWYNKHDLPEGFSDAEDEPEEEYPEEEGSGSSSDHEEDNSGDDSGDGSAYVASDEDQASE